jgi:Kef-type K+ transport system membrane component KefB
MEHLILEIGIVIIGSVVMGVLLYFLKQPLILAYILAGILLGPFGFGLIHDLEFIHGIATIGIMLMLFLVGLEMNTSRLKDLGTVALAVGIGQITFTGLFGFMIISFFDFTMIQSLYITASLVFSSTVIAVKLMSDKKDTKSFYGQICIGTLIVQDIVAIIALLLLAGFKEGSFAFDLVHFSGIVVKGILLALAAVYVSKYVLKHLYNKIAASHELLILFSLSWCFLISILSIYIGFSMEIGAFIAGLSLANLPYTFEINSKAKVLQDFFITIFFVALGAGMVFSSVGNLLVPVIILSFFVLVGNPIIVMTIMGLGLGYDKRTAFFTGLNIANISEFSLIVIALGSKLGHLEESVTSMVAIIAITTMVFSSYMITYNNKLYNLLKNYLSIFERSNRKNITPKKAKYASHIILFGCGRVGEQVLDQVLSIKDDYVVVEHDHKIIKELIDNNINCVFGDVEDEDLLADLDIEDAEIIISTLPNVEDNYILLKYLKDMRKTKRPVVITTANSAREGLELFNRGADYIVLKPYLGAQHIHFLNQELYNLEKNMDYSSSRSEASSSKGGKTTKTTYDQHEDRSIAKVVQGLNKLSLQEIKAKKHSNQLFFKSKLVS